MYGPPERSIKFTLSLFLFSLSPSLPLSLSFSLPLSLPLSLSLSLYIGSVYNNK